MTIEALRVFLGKWFCGCDRPEAAVERLRDILALCPLHSHREEFKALVPDDGIEMLLLYTLTHFDLIEHGGTVGGSWLTDEGTAVLSALQSFPPEVITESCCIHGVSMEGDAECKGCNP